MTLIGLSGLAGSGKNSVAQIVRDLDPDFSEIAFADPLRWICETVFGISTRRLSDPGLKERIMDEWGLSPRQIMQRLGTEVGRQIHPDVWIRAAANRMRPGGKYVVTDVRFPNEVDWIRRHGGSLWWIDRPGAVATSGAKHASENSVSADDADVVVDNTATLDHLRQEVARLL